MKPSIVALMIALLAGCAAQQGPDTDDAIADFIVVSEFEEMDGIKTRMQFGMSNLTERYIILRTRKDVYLVQFNRRCRELNDIRVTPDIRHDSTTLRPRIDTIRGCRIKKIFAIDEAGAEELKMLAEASGTERG